MSTDSNAHHEHLAVGEALPLWRGCAPPPRTAMRGQYVTLLPTDAEAHAAALFRAFSADEAQVNWTYLPYGPFAEQADFERWLADSCRAADPMFQTVLDAQGQPVGLASYLRIDPPVGVIEVGHIHFSPLLQRSPGATETMFLMMQRAFEELGYRRYEWKCDALNAPSRAAAERLGFVFEGVFRQATVYKGRNRDTAWLSVIDSEWPALKAGFLRWLNADNFDSAGRQRLGLRACRSGAKS